MPYIQAYLKTVVLRKYIALNSTAIKFNPFYLTDPCKLEQNSSFVSVTLLLLYLNLAQN